MPYMYILECIDKSYYTGSTWDLERRLVEHQAGLGAKHTAKHLPVKLVYYEECARIADAFAREKQVQGWGRTKKQALIAGDTNRLHSLAECENDSHSKNAANSSDFDSAQPPESPQARSLSGAEGNVGDGSNVERIEFDEGTKGIHNFPHDGRGTGGFDSAQPPVCAASSLP